MVIQKKSRHNSVKVQVEETIVKVPKIMQTVQHLTFQACRRMKEVIVMK